MVGKIPLRIQYKGNPKILNQAQRFFQEHLGEDKEIRGKNVTPKKDLRFNLEKNVPAVP